MRTGKLFEHYRELNPTIREAPDRISENELLARLVRCSPGREAAALVPPPDLTRQPGSPKRLDHRIPASRSGIVSASGSEGLIWFGWDDFGASFGRPRFRGIIEPHRQRDPTAYRVDFQDLDTDHIARLRNLARIPDESIGHRRDVHQPVLVNPQIDKGAARPASSFPSDGGHSRPTCASGTWTRSDLAPAQLRFGLHRGNPAGP